MENFKWLNGNCINLDQIFAYEGIGFIEGDYGPSCFYVARFKTITGAQVNYRISGYFEFKDKKTDEAERTRCIKLMKDFFKS